MTFIYAVRYLTDHILTQFRSIVIFLIILFHRIINTQNTYFVENLNNIFLVTKEYLISYIYDLGYLT